MPAQLSPQMTRFALKFHTDLRWCLHHRGPYINKWIIFCFTILSFQAHAAQDTCQLWNSSQAIDLNHNIPFHLYTAGAPLHDILEYPEIIPGSVIKKSRNYTSYWLSAGINSSLTNSGWNSISYLQAVLYKIWHIPSFIIDDILKSNLRKKSPHRQTLK